MTQAKTAREKWNWALLLILVLAAGLRFAALGRQSLWLDEATTASYAERDFQGCVLAEAQHPPLYNVMVYFVVRGLGSSEFALRLLPAIFGVLTVWMVWRVARRMLPGTEAWAAALAAVSPFLIYFSQEGRSYALFILLALVATDGFLRWRETGRGLAWHTAASVLLMYTHYFGAFVLLAQEAVFWRYVFAKPAVGEIVGAGYRNSKFKIRDSPNILRWITGRTVVAVAFAPWAIWVAQHFYTQAREWIGPATLRVPLALVRYWAGYGVAAVDYYWLREPLGELVREEWLVLAVTMAAFVWLLARGVVALVRATPEQGAFISLRMTSPGGETRTLLAGLLIVPVVVLLAISPWLNMVHERYLCFQAPFVLMLAAAGIVSLARKWRAVAGVACGGVMVFALVAYYTAPGEFFGYKLRYGKENWRGAAAYVESAKPDVVVLAPEYLRLPFERYWRGRKDAVVLFEGRNPTSFHKTGYSGAADVEELLRMEKVKSGRRVVLVLSHEGAAEERIKERFDMEWKRTAEKLFPTQAGIRVFVYE